MLSAEKAHQLLLARNNQREQIENISAKHTHIKYMGIVAARVVAAKGREFSIVAHQSEFSADDLHIGLPAYSTDLFVGDDR